MFDGFFSLTLGGEKPFIAGVRAGSRGLPRGGYNVAVLAVAAI